MSTKIPFYTDDHLTSLEFIAGHTEAGDDAGVNFYQHGARNYFFKLEGLSRIFCHTVDKKIFNHYKKVFKAAEDQLGDFDAINGLFIGIAHNDNSPERLIDYFLNEKNESAIQLQKFLLDTGWLPATSGKYQKLKNNLFEIDYPSDEKLRLRFSKFLINEIDKIIEKYQNNEYAINDIENGLHELRRRLRWISIYAQVTNGWIQLENNNPDPDLTGYLTEETIKSPFNILPPTPAHIQPLLIDASCFYALSWLIEELGNMKDQGLKVLALNKAFSVLNIRGIHQKKIRDLFNAPISLLTTIPEQAKVITDIFFTKHKVMHRIRESIEKSISV